MYTTIEPALLLRRAASFLCASALVVVTWFTLLAMAALVWEPTRSVIVLGPQETTLRAVTAGPAMLVDAGSTYVIAQGEGKGFVRDLYAGGAWLVLPAMSGGCRRRVSPPA
jgi:hypothetical protein